MKRTDALWLLAVPIYQLIGTVRHEGSHALVAVLQGATITSFRILPFMHPERGFCWGGVNWVGGQPTALAIAAPYLADLLVFALLGVLCAAFPRMPRWAWLNCFIIGVVSPLIDTAYNYRGFLVGRQNDVAYLGRVHGATAMHVLFATAILGYLIGTALVLFRFLRSAGAGAGGAATECGAGAVHETE
jgi:hypothetical protein